MKKFLIFPLLLVLLFPSCKSTGGIVRTVTITESATLEVKANIVSLSVRAESIQNTTSQAREEVNTLINSAIDTLKVDFGQYISEIHTDNLTISPYYEWNNNGQRELIGQRADESFTVVLNNIDKLGDVIDSLSEIDKLMISSISLDKDNKFDDYENVRRLAVQKALNKAYSYADELGLVLGEVISVSDGTSMSAYSFEEVAMDAVSLKSTATSSGTRYFPSSLTLTDSVSLLIVLESK